MGAKLGLSLREEHMLRVFENRVLRGTFGRTLVEVTADWRRLYKEDRNIIFCS